MRRALMGVVVMMCVINEYVVGPISLCDAPFVCPPGKTCQQNSSGVICVCGASSSCQTTSTNNVASEAACMCVHGNCIVNLNKNEHQCQCDPGWTGADCNDTCSLICKDGYRCEQNQQEGVEGCVPIYSTTITTTPLASTAVVNDNSTYNVCDDNYVRRFNNKCSIPCMYGICRHNEDKSWCECDDGAVGSLCQLKCCKDCGKHGTCYFHEEQKRELCNCQISYTGPYCDISQTYDSEEVTWYFWLAGTCALVLVVLIVLLVVMPYMLWRHRELFIMKVIHYFQKYEDDDDRQWDAFVSYKSNTADEQFVIEKLYVKLETDMGFKLNLHFRDFLPGETIANNIIAAVQGSRRTILVITPNYVTSEFIKLEYQVAQQEMLKRKHRIIPIMLEDISKVKDNMDPNLKVILNSVTYIEWPKDGAAKKVEKFWKLLELSLPKKKKRCYDADCKPSTVFSNELNSKDSKDIAIVDFQIKNDISVNNNVYTTISESKLDAENTYEFLNEKEMDNTRIFKSKQDQKSSPSSYINLLKIQV